MNIDYTVCAVTGKVFARLREAPACEVHATTLTQARLRIREAVATWLGRPAPKGILEHFTSADRWDLVAVAL